MDEYDGDNTTGAGWRGAGFSTTTCIYCGQGSTDVLNGRNKLLERKEESLNGELLDSHSGISGFRFFPIFPLFFYLGFFSCVGSRGAKLGKKFWGGGWWTERRA